MSFPPNVKLASDVSDARWVIEGLRPLGTREDRISITSVVPARFEAFARIKHLGEPGPMEGELPSAQVATLVRVLSSFTTSSDRCFFCFWDGYGFWWKASHVLIYAEGDPAGQRAEFERQAGERDQLMRNAPRVKGEIREYFLFTGPLSAVPLFRFNGRDQSPNLWWPKDRGWCVATDIDLTSTFVGGSRACIERLIRTRDLSANEVEAEDSVS